MSSSEQQAVLKRHKIAKQICPAILRSDNETAQSRDHYHYQLLSDLGDCIVDLGGGLATHNQLLAEDGKDVFVIDSLHNYWNDDKQVQ